MLHPDSSAVQSRVNSPNRSVEKPAARPPAALRVLIADDEPEILHVLGEYLRNDGYIVGEARDGVTALERFKGEKWDLVMTDRIMPGMRGDELAEEIKKLSPEMPIIMVTGFAPPGCCEAVDALIRKPFTHAAITAAILAVLPKA